MIAPADLNAYFQNLRTLWMECSGQIWEESEKPPIQQIPSSQALAIQPQKESLEEGLKAIAFMKRLAGDLQYAGLSTDVDTLDHFIYGDLEKESDAKQLMLERAPFQNYRLEIQMLQRKLLER